jgi:hypothetical protein
LGFQILAARGNDRGIDHLVEPLIQTFSSFRRIGSAPAPACCAQGAGQRNVDHEC